MFHTLYLYNGNDTKVFDCPMSLKQEININDVIAINEMYYKVYDIQYRFEVRGVINLMPVERKISARNRDEDTEYKSLYANNNRMQRAIDFFKRVNPLLNTGHSLESAYEKLYNE
jgi:hypothetical protein